MITSTSYGDMLRGATLFAGYTETDIHEVLRFSKLINLAKGEILFHKSEPCSAVYFVVSGFMKLYTLGPGAHEKVVEFIESGGTFAEAALFSGQGYPVNARALSESELIAIEAFPFTRLLQQQPELTWKMLSTLSRRLHQMVRQIETLSTHNAEQKVAAYLLDHCDVQSPPCAVDHLPTRRSDLASVLGITAETLCRTLGAFKKRGWIRTTDSRIVVLDAASLSRMLE